MDTMPIIRLVVADDHQIFLDGLHRLLEEQPDLQIAASVTNGREAIRAVSEQRPDLLLLDIDMPDMNAFAVTDSLREKDLLPRIILLTMHGELPYVLAASRPEIQGFVLKDAAFEDLRQAINEVMSGRRYASPSLGVNLDAISPLSPREREILRYAAEGKTNQQTAGLLGISVKTVESHRAHIIQKLRVANITEAVHVMP